MKTILYTFSATVTVVLLAATLSWSSILGIFGFTAIPLESLQALHASHQIADKMKQCHNEKKLNTSKRLVKRSTKRVASTAPSAATIGTAAVALTTISLEVADYCEEKRSLQEDANILDGTDIAFDLEQCTEEAEQDADTIFAELKNLSNKKIADTINATADYSEDAWDYVKDATINAVHSTGEVTTGVWDITISSMIDFPAEDEHKN